MTIHFDVTVEDGDRTLRIEGTNVLVGWIEQGRKFTDLKRNWTEWGFTPAAEGARYPVRDNIARAYEDAREHAATLLAPDKPITTVHTVNAERTP